MNQGFLLQGFKISLLLHGIVLFSFVFLGNLLPDAPPPLKIDFSIHYDSTGCLSEMYSEKHSESLAEQESGAPFIKKATLVRKLQPKETKAETNSPKRPKTKTVKSETPGLVLKTRDPLQIKKRMVVKEKIQVTSVESITEATSVQPRSKEMELNGPQTEGTDPGIAAAAGKESFEPQDASVLIPEVAQSFQTKSIAPKKQYINTNFSFIRDTVNQNIKYPDIARRLGWEGKVLVAFTVCSDGHVENIRVIKSCGFKVLDKNAIKTIQRCAPFPKPPLRAKVTLPITYRLN